MNALVPKSFGALPTTFAGAALENDLGTGISGGFGQLRYKGKVWSIHYKGNELVLMRDDGDGARGSVELIILKASQLISKVWYEKGYEEGSNAKPDCFSTNGVTPDPTSPKKQCNVCKLCPRDAFGSAIKQDGSAGKGKSCGDSRRMAVVPLGDPNNEMFGGPLLLRVPAGSLNDVATYGAGVQKMGFPYYAVGTRIAFDTADAYPKFVLSPIRALTEDEAAIVMALRNDARVDRILAENEYAQLPAAAQEPAKPAMAFEQPAQVAAPVAAAQPVQTAAAAAPLAPAPASGFGTMTATAQPPAQTPVAATVVEPPKTRAPRQAKAPAAAPAAPAAAPAASGFGPVATAAPAVTQPLVDPAAAASFDAELDAAMEELMGPATA